MGRYDIKGGLGLVITLVVLLGKLYREVLEMTGEEKISTQSVERGMTSEGRAKCVEEGKKCSSKDNLLSAWKKWEEGKDQK